MVFRQSNCFFTLLFVFCQQFFTVIHSQQPNLAVVNYGHLKSSNKYIQKKEEAKLKNALETIGFFILTNHNIDDEIMDNAWNDSQLFFDSNLENKLSIPMTSDYIYGYSNSERLSNSDSINFEESKTNSTLLEREKESGNGYDGLIDAKETFNVMIGSSKYPSIADQVLWPKHPAKMRQSWEAYYYQCERIIGGLLDSIANILEIDESFFREKIDNHTSALRASNYFILNDNNKERNDNVIRCSEHSDWGTLTLLRQDNTGGLQVEYNGVWKDVISDFYDFVVNIGDLLQRWTNDQFQSTRHRVVTSVINYQDESNSENVRIDVKNQRRQSMTFFHLINYDASIQTIATCLQKGEKSKYKPILAWEYLQTKHLSTQID